jgi:hypothetical protein
MVAGPTLATNKMFEDKARFHSRSQLEVKNANEVKIPISLNGLAVDSVLDAFFASWILFLHRYQKDALDLFSWTTSSSSVLYSLSSGGICFPSLHNVADLLSAVRDLRPEFELTDQATLPNVAFRDGVSDEASAVSRKSFCARH